MKSTEKQSSGVSLMRSVIPLVKSFCLILVLSSSLHAIPVEVGVTGAYAYRHQDTFDSGLKNYRTSLNPLVFSFNKYNQINRFPEGEFYVRIGDVISDESFFGFMYGRLYF